MSAEKVTLHIYTARNLPSKTREGVQAHVHISIGRDKFRTQTSQRSNYPEWNEKCDLDVKKQEDVLELKVKEGSETLGTCAMPVADLPLLSKGRRYYDLVGKRGESAGELCVDVWVSALGEKPAKKGGGLGGFGFGSMPAMKHSISATNLASGGGGSGRLSIWESFGRSVSIENGIDQQDEGGMPARRLSMKSVDGSHSPGGCIRRRASIFPTQSQPDETPIVTSIEPTKGPEVGGTKVSIMGDHFGYGPESIQRLQIGGVPVQEMVWISPRRIDVVTPAGAGACEIELIVDGAGEARCDAKFTYEHAGDADAEFIGPEVTGISPNNGPAGGGNRVTIRGDRLGSSPRDIVSVVICGVPCDLTDLVYVSDHSLKIITKPGQGGKSGPVIVTTKSGGVGRSIVHYKYNEPLKMKNQGEGAAETEEPAKTLSSMESTRSLTTESEESASTIKLKLEIKALKQTIEKLHVENKDLRDYIDRLLVRLINADPSLLETDPGSGGE
eukprot:comp8253_c0_seq1/m.3677 comp8253_c0_seq1/g.3677  ORF comp8253_c0_seq1/g.3677 comp8253_c0_seq1/m.3677 type:complete len:500 (-) comp8253_c0_seq1:350-1849(-)